MKFMYIINVLYKFSINLRLLSLLFLSVIYLQTILHTRKTATSNHESLILMLRIISITNHQSTSAPNTLSQAFPDFLKERDNTENGLCRKEFVRKADFEDEFE